MTKTPWPDGLKFKLGDFVQRKPMADGSDPVPLWRGTVCGWYQNPVSGEFGYSISSFVDRCAIQNYQERYLIASREPHLMPRVTKSFETNPKEPPHDR